MSKFRCIIRKNIAIMSSTLLLLSVFSTIILNTSYFAKAQDMSATVAYSGVKNNSGFPLSQIAANNTVLTTKTNLLVDKPVVLQAHDKVGLQGLYYDPAAPPNTITDGLVTDAFYVYVGGDAATRYMDFTYNLQGIATLENFVIFNHNSVGLRTYKYELYTADTAANLNTASPLITYTNTTGSQCQIFDIIGATNARFFRIRVLSENSTTKDCIRIDEIALYASSFVSTFDPNETISDDIADVRAISNELVTKSANAYALQDGNYKEVTTGNLVTLQDGKGDTEYFTYDVLFAKNPFPNTIYYDDGKNVYLDIIYNFGSIADITNVQMVNHSSTDLRAAHYQIYAANNEKDLYNPENLLRDYYNTEKQRRQLFRFSEGNADLKAQFVGLRIIDPISVRETEVTKVTEIYNEVTKVIDKTNNVYPRFNEFNVYGSYVDPSYLTYLANLPQVQAINEINLQSFTTNAQFTAFGSNLIMNRLADAKLNGVTATASVCRPSDLMKMTDAEVSYENDHKFDPEPYAPHNALYRPSTKDGSNYLDLIYSLGETPFDLSGFAFLGIGEINPAYYTGWYQVYSAVEYDDLFMPDSMIFEYNIKNSLISRGQVVTFKDTAKPRGSFVAVRILNPVTSATEQIYTRISEIAFYGTLADITPKPTNLADKMPINAYLTDKTTGNKVAVDSSNLTADEVGALTDGDKTSFAQIQTDGKQLDILYNLCGNINIDSLKVSSISDNTKYLKQYKVYSSLDINDVWTENALVYSYTEGKSPVQTNGSTFTKDTRLLSRYVRISIIDSGQGNICSIGEIEVIGMDNQKSKYKNIALAVSPGDIDEYVQNATTGAISFLSTSLTDAKKLIDNDKKTIVAVQGGIATESTLNVQMYLGDLKTVSSVSVNFTQKHDEYLPIKMNMYIEETEAKVMDLNAKPFATFTGKPVDGVYTIKMAPMLARYLRFSVVEGNPDLTSYDDMCIAFTEISIMGTSVKGMNTKSDNLLSYSDTETGISWDVIHIDTNDIFTAVASSKLLKSKATNWQKTSLNMEPYFKIVGDNIYEIQFYDITGKVVNDLNGRKVRIKVPITQDMTGNKTLLGNATDRKQITLYETVEAIEGKGTAPNVSVSITQDDGFKFALTTLSSAEDPYWSTIGELETFEDENPTPSDPGTESPETGEKYPWTSFIVSGLMISTAYLIKKNKLKKLYKK